MFNFLTRVRRPPVDASEGQGLAAGQFATYDDIKACFRLLFGRAPSPEEWPGYSSRAGEPLSVVVRSFLNSRGFQDRGLMGLGDFGDCEFVSVEGLMVAVSPDDIDVGKHLLAGSAYEPNISALFRRLLMPGMHVLDVGANCGYYTSMALALVGRSGHVWAVEPNVNNVRLLEVARRKNGVENLTIIPAAASDTFGALRLDAAFSNGMASDLRDTADPSSANIVCRLTLDSLFESDGRLDFVKLDVEGFEYRALKGLERTLDSSRPLIVSEFAPGMLKLGSDVSGKEYLSFLLQKGYRIGIVALDGSADLNHTADSILEGYEQSGIDHIDILAVPT